MLYWYFVKHGFLLKVRLFYSMYCSEGMSQIDLPNILCFFSVAIPSTRLSKTDSELSVLEI